MYRVTRESKKFAFIQNGAEVRNGTNVPLVVAHVRRVNKRTMEEISSSHMTLGPNETTTINFDSACHHYLTFSDTDGHTLGGTDALLPKGWIATLVPSRG